MPVRWTAENNQRLLLCVLQCVNVDKAQVAAAWGQTYGTEGGDQPTARAITEQLHKLKKDLESGGSKKPTPVANATRVKTEKVNSSRKASSKKRSRSASEEDDDDEDDETNIKEESTLPRTPESINPREKLARSSKAGRTFTQYNDDEDNDEDMRAYFDARNGNDTSPTPGSGKNSEFFEADDMSDVSEYTPDVE